ncbi:MAG: YeeE/YedE thiosulfate transporter family protein [Bacteroidetes bacterium]|nr:YeeE/YedE thiosulfate transporter family protein [Bacteroidota bacterium]MDA1333246.1 YeeE/YedE thiosulfate transporter family protein [Bacteroidota bacterium]
MTTAQNAGTAHPNTMARLLPYLLIGIYFGIVFTKSEVISWFRIQEMFRFQAFHMYGIIGSAVVVGMISIQLIKRFHLKAADGSEINIPPKELGKGTRYWAGGTMFGLGWALTGACPGPMFALVGNGVTVMLITILAAVVGTYTYGVLRPKLPH